jgi:hypothetical protein
MCPRLTAKQLSLSLLGGVIILPARLVAVENGTNSMFNESAPTSSDIPNWTSGWTQPPGQSGITGWNYVGTVAGGGGPASGVYLGNNWVLTAGHVGTGTFTLGASSYSVVPGSAQGISDINGNADICLFQISTAPNLPMLTIPSSGPSIGNSVAMLGYGDGGSITNETWGFNTVAQTGLLVTPDGYSYVTTDFVTDYGGSNEYHLVLGDSGGGDFYFDTLSGTWQLVGLNEDLDDSNNSYLEQLSTYASQINSIVATPEPSAAMCLGCGLLPLLVRGRRVRCRNR